MRKRREREGKEKREKRKGSRTIWVVKKMKADKDFLNIYFQKPKHFACGSIASTGTLNAHV